MPGSQTEAGRRRVTSLKTRLRASIVALVAVVVVVISGVNLSDSVEARFADVADRAQWVGEQVKGLLIERAQQQATARKIAPRTIEEGIEQWSSLLAEDELLGSLLMRFAVNSSYAVEICVTNPSGRILASSLPNRQGQHARPVADFREWRSRPGWRVFWDLLTSSRDLEVVNAAGVADRPVFYIHVVMSPVFVREPVLRQVRNVGVASVLLLVGAVVMSILFSNLTLRPLNWLGAEIDRITEGLESATPGERIDLPEVKAVQSKLALLGERYRGAREDALQLRSNIEQLVEKLEATVLVFDADRRVISGGRGMERLFGPDFRAVVGRRVDELFPASSALGALITEAVLEHRPVDQEEQVVLRPDGSTLRVFVSMEALEDQQGRAVGSLVTLRDAESRSQLEGQLNLSSRLAAISRLTGGVAHEIKNPLNAIALHAEVLRARIEGTEAAEAAGGEIDIITKEISRLDRVLKTFLDFTKPVTPSMANLSLASLVEEIGELVRPQAEKKGIAVAASIASGPLMISGDRDMLKQAILNVVLNAFDAMPEGGKVELDARLGSEGCLLSIRDYGPGIPPEIRDKIFNLYFSTKTKGSGIGLAMTYQVMQLHNATIDFSSDHGLGTTFRLVFPTAERDRDGAKSV